MKSFCKGGISITLDIFCIEEIKNLYGINCVFTIIECERTGIKL